MSFQFEPIGIIESCYKEKFGIPRQPNLVPDAKASLTLLPPFNQPESVRGLDAFSHVWLVFVFHATAAQGWSPTVRPPRLGGNARMGVFATRSTFRPNPIGLSVAQLECVVCQDGAVTLHFSGVDLLDGTPILDIKPYVPYADAVVGAQAGYAQVAPFSTNNVYFNEQSHVQCMQKQVEYQVNLQQLITDILQQDPRPSYHRSRLADRIYAMRLYNFDLKWVYTDKGIMVVSLDGE